MKTAFIVIGLIIVLLSALYHLCISLENQERELAGEPFKMEYVMSFWLLMGAGVICIVFGIFL